MRRHATSGSPFEEQFGFTRAVKEGNRIVVAGTGPLEEDGSTTPGDAAAQAERCCQLILKAIEDLGGSAIDVVRTRMFLTRPEDQAAVGEVHKNYFGDARPAATMVGVAWLCREDWLGEIEAEAEIGE